ncbi:hypothetical protein [Absidia glauca]|uniref:Uncharacterized protein n=1 Tax=Absidia glauca TaxID=4829 RepID=A0A163K1S4_ABSGL|nr:hypothetical protein [Absidia glauca]
MDNNKVINGGGDNALAERRSSVTSFVATSSDTGATTTAHRRESLVGNPKSLAVDEKEMAYDDTNIKMPDGADSDLHRHVDITNSEKYCEYNPSSDSEPHKKRDWSMGAIYSRYRCWWQ